MIIAGIPREDMKSVSTRVHFYYYLNALPGWFKWHVYDGRFGDVLYVQKKADDETISIALRAKILGVPVVYDCDDNPYEKPGKRRVTMLRLADAVTTDTEARGEQLKKASGISNVTVIPECVDYWDRLEIAPLRPVVQKVITFGNNSNAVNTAKYMKYVEQKCYHINSKKVAGAGKFIKWTYKSFVKNMCKADACILAHGDDNKSNLKLQVAMKLGIPTIVSDTKAYRETYEELGLLVLVAKTPADTARAMRLVESRCFRSVVRSKYVRYPFNTPEQSARALERVFENVCKARI